MSTPLEVGTDYGPELTTHSSRLVPAYFLYSTVVYAEMRSKIIKFYLNAKHDNHKRLGGGSWDGLEVASKLQ